MRKFGIFMGLLILLSACGAVDQNLQARKQLANCEYDLDSLQISDIGFLPVMMINGKDVPFLEISSVPVLLANREQIQLKNFNIKLEKLGLDLFLKITNTTEYPVALDSVEGDIYLDSRKAIKIEHKNFVRIEPGQSAVEKIALQVPFDELQALNEKKVKDFTVEVAVQINILMGSFTLKTPFTVRVKKTFPVPYHIIDEKMEGRKQEVIQKAKDSAAGVTDPDSVKKKLKKFF